MVAVLQVRLPKAGLSGIRVLAAEDLFELLELCLITDRREYIHDRGPARTMKMRGERRGVDPTVGPDA